MDFKFTIKTKSGKLIVDEIVSFGTDKTPFPVNWRNEGIALMALLNYREEFIEEHLDITYEES